MWVPTSNFLYTCDGVVFHPTYFEMSDVREPTHTMVYIAEMTGLPTVDFLPRFPNVLCLAFLVHVTQYMTLDDLHVIDW